MDQSRLDEIISRLKNASKGPWTSETGGYSGNNWLIGSLYLGRGYDNKDHWIHITTDHVHASEVGGSAEGDAEFISNSRTDIRDLLVEIVRLQKILIEQGINYN